MDLNGFHFGFCCSTFSFSSFTDIEMLVKTQRGRERKKKKKRKQKER